MLYDPIIIAFLVIALGFVFQRKIGFDQKTVSNLLIYVLGPALVFSSIYSKQIVPGEFLIIAAGSVAVIAVCGAVAFVVFRIMNYKNTGMLTPAMFANSGYLGFPITLFALGELGLQKMIIFDAVGTIFIFTLGVYLVHPQDLHWKEKVAGIFKIPLIYAIILAIALNLAAVLLPALLISSLTLIGSATIPLALIVLGGRLATLKLGNLRIPLAAVGVRFLAGGAAGFAFISLLNLHGIIAGIIMLGSIMPPAVNSYVLNEKFGKDPENAATAVLIGTLLSIIPIAIVLSFI